MPPAPLGSGYRAEEGRRRAQAARRGREPVFKASAVQGEGVLASFFGLLSLTWSKLDSEHQLARTMGIDASEFLPRAAEQLGYTGDVSTLLSTCVGGSLAFPRPESAP